MCGRGAVEPYDGRLSALHSVTNMTKQNNKPELFVVDGSNIATEGRSKPSLEQLNEAVDAFKQEYPDVRVTVVVDATFGHRIAKKEVTAFDTAVANNDLVTPPAGAVGRGDAFILAIADKVDAGVFSNDSFQEFHGEYGWLFDHGRLIGGKPVPHVGWVFVDRNPVRGPKSRESIRAAKKADADEPPTAAKDRAKRRVRKKKAAASTAPAEESSDASTEESSDASTDESSSPPAQESEAPSAGSSGKQGGRSSRRSSRRSKQGARSSDGSAAKASGDDDSSGGSTGGGSTTKHVNELMPFLEFVERHAVGQTISGVVESYSSHGAYAKVDDVSVYIPLRLMADPAPTSARKVLKLGDEVELVVAAYAPERRSIDVALPAMASTIEAAAEPAEVVAAATDEEQQSSRRGSRRRSKRRAAEPTSAPAEPTAEETTEESGSDEPAPKKRAARKRAPAKKKAAAKKAPAKKRAARKRAPAKKKAAAKKAPAKKKAAAKKAPAKKKAAAKKAPAKKKAAARKRSSATSGGEPAASSGS
jgi:hypothetical protein